jgi:hypothetical protein
LTASSSESITIADRTAHVSLASRALALAGRALDPNEAGGPDCALATLLLRHTVTHAAAASGGEDGLPSVTIAIHALERSGALGATARDASRGRAVLACLEGDEPVASRDDLVATEVLLVSVLRTIRGEPAIARSLKWSRRGLAIAFAGAVVAVMLPRWKRGSPWQKFRWKASSAGYGFGTEGTLGTHGSSGLVFHTAYEERPWVLVDLLATRTIHTVKVVNRSDCCDERCLPLVVEVAGEDGQFTEVGRRTDTFAEWTVDFAPRRARTVRLRVEARTYFHLQEIEIR